VEVEEKEAVVIYSDETGFFAGDIDKLISMMFSLIAHIGEQNGVRFEDILSAVVAEVNKKCLDSTQKQ